MIACLQMRLICFKMDCNILLKRQLAANSQKQITTFNLNAIFFYLISKQPIVYQKHTGLTVFYL